MTINDSAEPKTAREAVPSTSPVTPKWFAALGLAAGLGAVAASSCCILALGLAALGASAGILGGLEALAGWRIPFLALSAFAVVGGWTSWRSKRPSVCVSGSTCASPSRSRATLALLLCASVLVIVAGSWGYIEPTLLKMMRGR
jgi:mercuric ion transport protein